MEFVKPFFSVVVPCYNDGRYAPGVYLDRLLYCLVEQNISKDDLQVILVDDHSPIPYGGTIDRYSGKLNINTCVTDYNFGPGNTRERGVKEATGEWLFFIDHDDKLYPGTLLRVKEALERSGENLILKTDFNKVSYKDERIIVEEFSGNNLTTWLHGKFYNLDNFWRKYNIHFPKDLKTHEDLAVGYYVECILHSLGDEEHAYMQYPTYMWTHRPDSVSHSQYVPQSDEEGAEHPFLETVFDDHLRAFLETYLTAYDNNLITRDEAIFQCLQRLISIWSVLASFKVNNPHSYYEENEAYCSRMWHRIKDKLEITAGGAKVLIQSKFNDKKDLVDRTAVAYGLSDLNAWIDEIDKMDYNAVLDKALAERLRKSNKPLVDTVKDLNRRPFFSIVIACYNDGRYQKGVYLDRLLNSLTRQEIPGYDIEVVLSDDCSPTPFDSIVAEYEDKLLIKRIKTDYNFAPGNTRAKGVTIATGEWLAFADHDDIYYDGALSKIKNAILQKNEQHFIFGDFNGVTPEGEVLRKYERSLNWCHAKFYNRDNFWDKYGIHFIKDLRSHEDIAICTQVSCILSGAVQTYTYLHTDIYAWTDNPQSVSHRKYSVDTEEGPREFLEVFFSDYIEATGMIYLQEFKKHSIKMAYAIKACLEIMLYCYFYLQGFQFRRPDDFYKKNVEIAGQFVRECKQLFNMTNQSMYNAISANNAYMYYQIQEYANGASGHYIPTQTLRQWFDLVAPDGISK